MNFTKPEIQNRMTTEQPKKVIALINTYNGGRYGRSGQYKAVIKPIYFKNGNYKQQNFVVIERLETIRKEYGYSGCNHSESIAEILDIL